MLFAPGLGEALVVGAVVRIVLPVLIVCVVVGYFWSDRE
jgi:hypothetical protein